MNEIHVVISPDGKSVDSAWTDQGKATTRADMIEQLEVWRCPLNDDELLKYEDEKIGTA